MLQLAARPGFVVPGHDPSVMTRFPAAGRGSVEIR